MNKENLLKKRQLTVKKVIKDGGKWLNKRGFHSESAPYDKPVSYTTNEKGYFDRFRVLKDHDRNTIVCFPCGLLLFNSFKDFLIKQMKRYRTDNPDLTAWYFCIWDDRMQSILDEKKTPTSNKLVIKNSDVDESILSNDKAWLENFAIINNCSFTPKDGREKMIDLIDLLHKKMVEQYKI